MTRLINTLVISLVCCLTSLAQAELVVDLGTHVFPQGAGIVAIPISIQGTDPVHAFDAYLQIGDGFGGDNAPTISYLGASSELTGNFMATSPNIFLDSGSDAYNVAVGDILSTLNANISPQTNGGLLLTLLVDLSGKVAGQSWDLIGDDTGINGAGSFSSQIGNVNAPVASLFVNGTIAITVPEPSSLLLACCGLIGLIYFARHSASS